MCIHSSSSSRHCICKAEAGFVFLGMILCGNKTIRSKSCIIMLKVICTSFPQRTHLLYLNRNNFFFFFVHRKTLLFGCVCDLCMSISCYWQDVVYLGYRLSTLNESLMYFQEFMKKYMKWSASDHAEQEDFWSSLWMSTAASWKIMHLPSYVSVMCGFLLPSCLFLISGEWNTWTGVKLKSFLLFFLFSHFIRFCSSVLE